MVFQPPYCIRSIRLCPPLGGLHCRGAARVLDPGMSVVSPADDDDLLVLNVGNGWEWMGMGVAGIIITSDYGLFPKIPC